MAGTVDGVGPIPPLRGLATFGLHLGGKARWAKGSTWALTFERGRVVDARYLAPIET